MWLEATDMDAVIWNAAAQASGRQPAQLRAVAESELRHFELNHLSYLNHDLNNNLGAISLHLEVLKHRLGRHADLAEELSVLNQAQQSIDHTTHGMQRLLAHARLRSKATELHVEFVDLRDLIRGVVTQFEAQAGMKGLELVVDVEPNTAVFSDDDVIAIVLQNLVGNAVKYSRRGRITVVGRVGGAGDDGVVVLQVCDEGPGIAPDRAEHLFAAFRRGESHGQEGLGLGLAIASEAVRLLRATLSVESHLGIGSTFSLRLPFHPGTEDTSMHERTRTNHTTEKGSNHGLARTHFA